MEVVAVKNLTFAYPSGAGQALTDISFTAKSGELLCLCGKSASGKSTLLHLLKPSLAPHGRMSGAVEIFGRKASETDMREEASRIGFVMQSPDNQIVTDKVWHELAFGLENLGTDPSEIRLRVAEMAHYFGIETWFDRSTENLSGGQKQLLNLASVMVLQPEILLLDEPTARLDPIAASDFLTAVKRISRDLGTTVIIAEQRPEEIIPDADRVLVMDGGRLMIDAAPQDAASELAKTGHDISLSMPVPIRISAAVCRDDSITFGHSLAGVHSASCDPLDEPLDVASGRRWLSRIMHGREIKIKDAGSFDQDIDSAALPAHSDDLAASYTSESLTHAAARMYSPGPGDLAGFAQANGDAPACGSMRHERPKRDAAVRLKNIRFRYGKNEADALRGLSLEIPSGEILCILGGNASGKSTLLKVIAGALKPYSGKRIVTASRISMLVENPELLFSEDTIRRDLLKMAGEEDILEIARLVGIEDVLDAHPYDVSGGEQQRAALAKVLLKDADLLLLDEPTKGMDNAFKEDLGALLRGLTGEGKTIACVSHDLEFCARYADNCAMMFGGEITQVADTRSFFTGNHFYTTAANRMSRHIFSGAITPEDVIRLVKANE